jgi:hypothetical protein
MSLSVHLPALSALSARLSANPPTRQPAYPSARLPTSRSNLT